MSFSPRLGRRSRSSFRVNTVDPFISDETVADLGEIDIDLRVVAHGHFLLNLLRSPSAEFDILLPGVGLHPRLEIGALRRSIGSRRQNEEQTQKRRNLKKPRPVPAHSPQLGLKS